MRSILKYTFLVAFCGLSLITSVNSQITSPTPPVETNKPVDAPEGLKIEFPDVEGWKRSKITKYPIPELGYSVNYDSAEAGRVTVYVYDLGLTNIPDGVENDIVKNEITRAKDEVVKVGEMGLYQDVKELKNDTLTLGGQTGKIKSLHSTFNYSARGQPLVSEIYLLGYRKNFIKIRATYPKVEGEGENKALSELLLKIEDLLSK